MSTIIPPSTSGTYAYTAALNYSLKMYRITARTVGKAPSCMRISKHDWDPNQSFPGAAHFLENSNLATLRVSNDDKFLRDTIRRGASHSSRSDRGHSMHGATMESSITERLASPTAVMLSRCQVTHGAFLEVSRTWVRMQRVVSISLTEFKNWCGGEKKTQVQILAVNGETNRDLI